MNVAAIVETLAKEFNVDGAHAQRVFDLLSAGLKAPTIARYRRSEIGPFTDGTIHRFERRLRQLQELERRRQSLLRSIEEQRKQARTASDAPGCDESLEALEACMDRFELEDHFLPHRRPEPEVQLALDRGLGALADLLVAPAANDPADQAEEATAEADEEQAEAQEPERDEPDAEADSAAEAEETESSEPVAEAAEASEPAPDVREGDAAAEATNGKDAGEPEDHAAPEARPASDGHESAAGEPYVHATRIDLSPQLARLCAPFVNPDRDIHTDAQALEGAMRILSDRLGRSPSLRGLLRRLMRKHGRISTRAIVDEKKLGKNRALLRLDMPLRQIQGHRLLALRQAQSQRLIATTISVDEKIVLPKVRAALGKRIQPEYASVADVVSEQALRQRLLPMIEEDVRNELRERADEEAIRFLAQHLRQILLAPPLGPRTVAGIHVDAKGDWLLGLVDRQGEPFGGEIRLEASGKTAAELAPLFAEALRGSEVQAIAAGHGKGAREAVHKLRETIQVIGADAAVFLVNEAGLSNYANSEHARRELPEHSVPARHAISLARRLQDPMRELLKAELRHLGLGREQAVISKANLRRVLHDTVESCVAHVGCDLNTAPLGLLRYVPGLNFELAKKLVERRADRPFTSREELRTEALLDDVTWTNAIGYLRVPESHEPLDRTGLHPEQYDLVRRIILESGSSIEETLGRRDATKGMRRGDYEVDDATWRDIMREVSHPGRDPRPRLFFPRLLPPDAEPKTLQKDQVVEGIVSNVASFGAFVDLGVPRDGMIHISEISNRYVRDARGLLSIGQIVRARVLDSGGQRVELSLKGVPDHRRRGGPSEGGRPARGDRRSRPDRERSGPRGEAWPEYKPVLRAARSRRDGLVTGSDRPDKRERRRGGGAPAHAKSGAGGRRGAGRGRRGGADDQYDPEAVRRASNPAGSYNPFATFFKGKKEAPEEGDAAE